MATNNSKYDWEAIEREYRTGQFSDSELSRRHGCSRTAIQKKVATQEWTRDLSEAVRQAAKAKMVKEDARVAGQVAGRNAKDERDEIELAAETRLVVLRDHRKGIADLARLEASLLAELEDSPTKLYITQYQGGIVQAEVGIAVTERASALQALAGVQHKRIQLERQAFNLDDKAGPVSDIESILEEVASRNTGLVKDDDSE